MRQLRHAATFAAIGCAWLGCVLSSGSGGDPDTLLHPEAGVPEGSEEGTFDNPDAIGSDTPSSPSDAGTDAADGSSRTVKTDGGTLTITPLGSTTQSIGPSGGTISLGKASLVVPAGALTKAVSIGISAESFQEHGKGPTSLYHFTPDGQTFAAAATVNLPGTGGVIYWSQAEGNGIVFAKLPTTLSAGMATAKVMHFSRAFLGDESCTAFWGCTPQCAPCSAGETSCPCECNLLIPPVCPPGYQVEGLVPLTCLENLTYPSCPCGEFPIGGGPIAACFPISDAGNDSGTDAQGPDAGPTVTCMGAGSCGGSAGSCSDGVSSSCSTTQGGHSYTLSCTGSCTGSCSGACGGACGTPCLSSYATCPTIECTCAVDGATTSTATMSWTGSVNQVWPQCKSGKVPFPGTPK
jgi:hypothetical protein